jgi:hypothetical protein
MLRFNVVRFYKLPEDTCAYEIIPSRYRDSIIHIDRVPTGIYKIRYNNYYDEFLEKTVSINQAPFQDVKICPDLLSNYSRNTLPKLQNNQTITISYRSKGCYHSEMSKLVLIKKNDGIYSSYYRISRRFWERRDERYIIDADSLVATSKLSDLDLAAFKRFENELAAINGWLCTVDDTYVVKSKYLKVKKTESTCKWSGFPNLIRVLYPELK